MTFNYAYQRMTDTTDAIFIVIRTTKRTIRIFLILKGKKSKAANPRQNLQ